MREIKFRALKDDMSNCSFVYGQLVYDAIDIPRITVKDKSSEGLFFHTCIKGTEGQYAGLKDKCEKELYDGDLFKCETDDIIYRVWAVKGGFAINTHVQIWQKDINLDYPFPLIPLADEQTVSWFEGSCTIIGNIHENANLLNP